MKQLVRTFGVVVCILLLSFALTILQKDVINPYEWMIAVTVALASAIALLILVLTLINNLLRTPEPKLPPDLPKSDDSHIPNRPTAEQIRSQSAYGKHNMPGRDRSFEARKVWHQRMQERNHPRQNAEEWNRTYGRGKKPLWNPEKDDTPPGFKDITQRGP
ncbi:MAG: hypothetical protein K8L99_32345 [Anaerolineae bacterium]|nr:hypothetical protein [Anaerolineae bacterium]